jgi:hypothetical protein
MRTPDVRMPGLGLALAMLAACQQGGASDGTSGRSPLERAALDAGVVSDAAATDPAGLYARQHEGGRDTLCLVPDDKPGRYRFGADVNIGAGEYCRGSGKARRTGDKLILHFSGRSGCLIVAGYEGDRIALPGVLDIKCAALCADRASMEGVSFPLLSSDAGAARDARGAGGRLCR